MCFIINYGDLAYEDNKDKDVNEDKNRQGKKDRAEQDLSVFTLL